MTFDELCSEVYTLTNRPDLVAETQLAVRQATLKMHTAEFYFKDEKTALLSFETSAYLQSFDTSLVQRYRANKLLRFWDPAGIDSVTQLQTGKAGNKLIFTEADSMLDSYSIDKSDVYYIAGTQVNVKAKAAFQFLLWIYYEHPRILPAAQYKSWIADEFPYAIVFEAAALVFKTIGYDEQSAKYDKYITEQIILVKMSNIVPEGY